jgi:hypothetical protein
MLTVCKPQVEYIGRSNATFGCNLKRCKCTSRRTKSINTTVKKPAKNAGRKSAVLAWRKSAKCFDLTLVSPVVEYMVKKIKEAMLLAVFFLSNPPCYSTIARRATIISSLLVFLHFCVGLPHTPAGEKED